MKERKRGGDLLDFREVLLISGALLALIWMQLPPPSQAQEEESTSLEASQDTWVDASLPEEDHRADEGLVARFSPPAESRVLVGFDLGALEASRVRNARLELSLVSGEGLSPLPMAVAGIQAPWRESVSWPEQPGRTATAGIVEIGLEPVPVVWEVTSVVTNPNVLQDSVIGFALSGPFGDTPPYARTLASRESDTPPKLLLTFDSDNGASPASREDPPGSGNVRAILTIVTGVLVALIAAAWIFSKFRRGTARREG